MTKTNENKKHHDNIYMGINNEHKQTKVSIKSIIICLIFLAIWTSFYTCTYVIYKFGTRNTNLFYQKILRVTSEDKTWYQNQNINIFDNTNANGEKVIWEGLQGKYEFTVENVYKDMVFFGLLVEEKNLQEIEIKYRFKSNNIYIVGNKEKWADIKELNIDSIKLLPSQKATYTLEWMVTDIDDKYLINREENARYTLYVDLYSN